MNRFHTGVLPSALALLVLAAPASAQAPVAPTPATTIQDADGNDLLILNSDGGFLVPGQDEAAIPIEGNGTRMMWHAFKGAFRAGNAFGGSWDDLKVGTFSVAFGYGNTASGYAATALGDQTEASGDYSLTGGLFSVADGNGATALGHSTASGLYATSLGRETVASGNYALAAGYQTNASGLYSLAGGYQTDAIGPYSTALGALSQAEGDNSTALGNFTRASGDYSASMGRYSVASGDYSTAMGYNTNAIGAYSTAIGYQTTATGNYSTAMGLETEAPDPYGLVVGIYNKTNECSQYSLNQDILFGIGDGTSSVSRSNAFTVCSKGIDSHPSSYFDGQVYATSNMYATAFVTTSDRRLKTDIAPLEPVLDRLLGVEPVTYRLRQGPGNREIGLIAQDVQEAFPELVSERSDGMLAVSYGRMTAVLLRGLQEQQAEIERLHAEVAVLQQPAQEAGLNPVLALLLVVGAGGLALAARRLRAQA